MKRIYAISRRGKHKGTHLTPHRYQEGHYLVSKGGNTIGFATREHDFTKLERWIQQGYSVRMSSPGIPPSIYAPKNLIINR
jgi:hypothetical protein